MSDVISGALQENILVLLCFDDETAPLIINSVNIGLFESEPYKEIAKQAVEYYAQFKETPKDHLGDLLEEQLNDEKDSRKADLYKKILINLYEFKDNINTKYVISKITEFVRQQRLKSAIVDATTQVKEGNLDNAENILNKSLKSTLDVFDPGIRFTDTKRSLGFFDNLTPAYSTGIKPLDIVGFGPAPGELLIMLASANRGKTWGLVHLGKFCALQRLKVLHVSLEMSEEKMAQRYVQNFYSYGKRKSEAQYMNFTADEMGRFVSMDPVQIERPSLFKLGIQGKIEQKLLHMEHRLKLWIKRFPTGALTIQGLEAYLDAMDRFHHFQPDVLIVDYADLMKLNSMNLRIDTGNLYKDLRRICVERNLAGITASQSNRLGEDAKIISLKHLAEDYSKAAIADNILAYCQTSQELKLGLARLFIAKARDEEREQTILISQCYRIGQFCMNAIPMQSRYWDNLEIMSNRLDSNVLIPETAEPQQLRRRLQRR